ncbi:DUF4145 domain-containing protein [Photobacterium galatheae]|uniref:Uncharacterized protein n=1 Tax=Photobacterium galatheae TaxID=1654360 RepID=A0A066RH87_9GAMM|nr:DUF4145 domain-containing protein [Photobacterium galatheae]KDM89805.1 hypothetical protein EA58_20345 [Photobacterium galatheae]MCM0151455.1 hypothetical protein [Photobacterium galatheae]
MIISTTFSIVFLSLAYVHLFISSVDIDAITIVLMVLAALPWVFPYLKSLELPGGIKVEMKNVLKKVEQASAEIDGALPTNGFQGVDTSLAFIAQRVEIEKIVRQYQPDLPSSRFALTTRLTKLAKENILQQHLADALLEIVKLGNLASQGQFVHTEEAELILMRSGPLLDKLEQTLSQAMTEEAALAD